MDTPKHQNQMMFVGTWFGSALSTLALSFVLIIYLSQVKIVSPANGNFKLYAAVPTSGITESENIDYSDARAKIIEGFFKGHNSPLADLSEKFVEVADRNQLDYRVLPAIAMQESNGGKRMIKDSYNPFGYGIYGDLVVRFSSFEEAIERVGKALREDYLNKGLQTPNQIMAKYTPPSLEKGGSWAIGVSSFMEDLR